MYNDILIKINFIMRKAILLIILIFLLGAKTGYSQTVVSQNQKTQGYLSIFLKLIWGIKRMKATQTMRSNWNFTKLFFLYCGNIRVLQELHSGGMLKVKCGNKDITWCVLMVHGGRP